MIRGFRVLCWQTNQVTLHWQTLLGLHCPYASASCGLCGYFSCASCIFPMCHLLSCFAGFLRTELLGDMRQSLVILYSFTYKLTMCCWPFSVACNNGSVSRVKWILPLENGSLPKHPNPVNCQGVVCVSGQEKCERIMDTALSFSLSIFPCAYLLHVYYDSSVFPYRSFSYLLSECQLHVNALYREALCLQGRAGTASFQMAWNDCT